MKIFLLYVLFFCGLFYFSEGKSCPEKTRPHKTRCDAFFRCQILPNKSQVWVPEKCEQGLIYERILKICVLPGDDWECNLDESNKQTSDENNIYGVNILNVTDQKIPYKSASKLSEEKNIEMSADIDNNDSSVTLTSGEIMESDEDFESSGDGIPEGAETIEIEIKESDDEIMNAPMASNVDPNLKAHLQRLTQIIDGLKDKYQNKDSPVADLRPDQLNAFLAHYNIKAEFDSINPKDQLEQVPVKKTENNSFLNDVTLKNKTGFNSTNLKVQSQLDPETKVVLTNSGPKRVRGHYQVGSSGNGGYSNSQIVVNRPEGSVLFSLPQNEYDQQHDYRNEPKISEETLKTVLELSKQMLANQNFRQVIPAQNFYQPLVQPIYLPAAVSQQFTRPSSNKYEYSGNHHYGSNKKYAKPLQETLDFSNPDRPDPEPIHKRPTTIIHNNVIPVHVTSSTTTTNKERDKLNSYGEPIQNYDSNIENFPPFSTDSRDKYHSNRFENNKFPSHPSHQTSYNSDEDIEYNKYPKLPNPIPKPSKFTPSLTSYYTPNPHLNENNVHHVIQVDNFPQEQFSNIPRPIDLNRPQTQSHINSFNSAYPHSHQNYHHHHQQRPQYQKPRPTIQSMYEQYQSQFDDNQYFNTPSPLSLFPQNINPDMVNIRPNSYKTESMESTESGNNGSGSSGSSSTNSNSYYENDEDMGFESDEDDIQIYNRISANKKIVTNELTRNVDQTNQKNIINRRKDSPPFVADGSQLVNLGGNFISYDVFQNSVLPSLGGQTIDKTNVEIITCSAGIRQPNASDCTRYFVCSKKDGKILSYSCPPFTGFNSQTRVCDARTYSVCNPEAIVNRYTVEENRRIQLEALQSMKEAQRIRDQTAQAQNLANLFQSQYSAIKYNKPQNVMSQSNPTSLLQNLAQNGATNIQQQVTIPPTKRTKVKRRKYFCRENDKIPDQTSIYNYFVCYKSNGVMKGHKMTCSKGLLFCPRTSMCTLPNRCS